MKELFRKIDANELKLIYRTLHKNLLQEPALMDSRFLEELQRHLQAVAGSEGIDTSNHAEWDQWLNA